MHNFSFRIARASDNDANTAPSTFAKNFFAEIGVVRKADQSDITVEHIDHARLCDEVHNRHEAHAMSSGEASIIALDARSTVAFANGCTAIVVSYDFFQEAPAIADASGVPVEDVLGRLYNALSHAERVIIVGDEARRMAWAYCRRPWHFVQLPPLSCYRNADSLETAAILAVVHDPNDDELSRSAEDLCREYPTATVINGSEQSEWLNTASENLDRNHAEVALIVHLGRDRRSRSGFRLLDSWVSGVPVAQLLRSRGAQDEDDDTLGVVTNNETGLLSTDATDLCKDVSTILGDPILASVLTKRGRAEATKLRPLWHEIIDRALHGEPS